MQLSSLVLKQSFLQLGVVLTKHTIRRICSRSSSSPIPSIQREKFSIVNPIHIKFILQPSSANYIASLLSARKILLNFGNVLAISTGDSTKPLTRIQNCLILHLSILAKLLGIIARKSTATTLSNSGR